MRCQFELHEAHYSKGFQRHHIFAGLQDGPSSWHLDDLGQFNAAAGIFDMKWLPQPATASAHLMGLALADGSLTMLAVSTAATDCQFEVASSAQATEGGMAVSLDFAPGGRHAAASNSDGTLAVFEVRRVCCYCHSVAALASDGTSCFLPPCRLTSCAADGRGQPAENDALAGPPTRGMDGGL